MTNDLWSCPSVTFTLEVIPTPHLPVIASHRLTIAISNVKPSVLNAPGVSSPAAQDDDREITRATELKRLYMVRSGGNF